MQTERSAGRKIGEEGIITRAMYTRKVLYLLLGGNIVNNEILILFYTKTIVKSFTK